MDGVTCVSIELPNVKMTEVFFVTLTGGDMDGLVVFVVDEEGREIGGETRKVVWVSEKTTCALC